MSVVYEQVMRRLVVPNLTAYIVWVPVLDGDDAARAQEAAARVSGDRRVSQYWDADRALARAMANRLHLPRGSGVPGSLAWDVYLVFDRGARWPNDPVAWMHQLSRVHDHMKLDGAVLRARVAELVQAR